MPIRRILHINKIILLVAILFIIINISCVSAAENEGGLDNATILQNAEPADFSNLAEEINSSEKSMVLTKDYEYNSQSDSQYSQGIDIAVDGFVIDGQGHTINGNRQTRIFNINANNVVLKNMTLINGYSDGPGGCVFITHNNVSIINATFKDSYSDKWGGAVSFKYGGNVIESNFENNKAGTGGALDFGNDAQVIDSTFSNNYALFQGGAISFYGDSIVRNSLFENNTGGDGASIYSESLCSIYDSKFIKNYAIGYGGIYFMAGGNVINSTFAQNTAVLDGGAINIRSGKLSVINTEFNHSSAKLGMSFFIKTDTFRLENLTFNNENCSFDSEIYINSGKPTISNLSFNNVSKNDVPIKNETVNDAPKQDDKKITPTTVTKKKTTITAKSKTFKTKTKTKKYSILLKSGKTPLKYKKVTLKIKGKTYTVKTNKKGKSTFKLKITKKGKFKATITFKGDKSYKASKKMVYIKIK